jgi:transcriptional regulator with XRE-family HTH domain
MASTDDKLASNIARNLKELRLARGLSQEQLSQASGIPRPTWANLESGSANPTVSILAKVANTLQVSVEELISPPRATAKHYLPSALPTRRRGEITIRRLLPDVIQSIDLERMEFAPNATMIGVPHRAGTREYLTCESGQVILTVSGERYHLNAGDVVVFRGDQKHSYLNPTGKTTVAYSIVLLAPPS